MASEDDYTVEIRKLEIRKHEDAIRAMLPGKHGNELTEILLRANSIRKLMVDWRSDFDLTEEWWEQLHAMESEREAAKSEAIREAKRHPGERALRSARRAAIRKEAFEEAAEAVLDYVEGSSVRMIAAEIRTLGEPKSEPEPEPKPDPRSRRITVKVSDKWTYVFDRDILINQDARQQVPLTEGEADMGDILERIIALTRPERDLLLYALEQERAKLAVASFASTSWQDAGVAAKRLGHLNLFLGERT
jgi:hypothetical protein